MKPERRSRAKGRLRKPASGGGHMPIASPVAQAEVSGWPAGQDNPVLETAVDMAESFELDQSILRGDEERALTTTGSVEVGAWTDAEAETASNERSTSEPFEF